MSALVRRSDVGTAACTAALPVAVATYFALGESSAGAATWGKKRVGLRVLDVGGGHLGRGKTFARAFLKFLPWQKAHTAMLHIPGFPMASTSPPTWTIVLLVAVWVLVAVYLAGLTSFLDSRTVYDRLVGSCVVASPGSA